MQQLRREAHRLQLLSQPALPEVPGPGACANGWPSREAELLPVPYFHVVFTLPARIAEIAYPEQGGDLRLCSRPAAETMLTIAADPKHLGARIGILSVLHTWGSALTQHPHS